MVLIPDLLRKYYGTMHAINARSYEVRVRYMRYMQTEEWDGGLIEHGLGDWSRGIAHGNNQGNIETVFYYECLRCLARFAAIMEKREETEYWEAEAERIKPIYSERLLVRSEDSEWPYVHYTSRDEPEKRDHDAVAQAFALRFGFVPEESV